MKKIIDLYPEATNEWLWRDHAEDVKREFYPSVSIPAQDEPLWHECEPNYKEGYDLLWSLRQEEHTAEECQSIEAKYSEWQSSNPSLAEEIAHAVPTKPEQEQEE